MTNKASGFFIRFVRAIRGSNLHFLCLFVATPLSLPASDKIETLRLDPGPNMTRAELHFIKTTPNSKAVLVLCPGHNGSGENLVTSDKWKDFARKNNLALVGLSFASPLDSLQNGTGYYHASTGSGEKLLEGIRKIYGRDLPLLLYGISGGAHFTSRFEQWKPERVIAWCAYSAGWWDEPRSKSVAPPGIVACGDEDGRYGASLIYFKQGRATGHPWLWVSLPRTGHTGSAALDEFVRSFFATVLSSKAASPVWIDVDSEQVILPDEKIHPALTGWLPSDKLLESWRQIHEP